jgi:hypothetical protein
MTCGKKLTEFSIDFDSAVTYQHLACSMSSRWDLLWANPRNYEVYICSAGAPCDHSQNSVAMWPAEKPLRIVWPSPLWFLNKRGTLSYSKSSCFNLRTNNVVGTWLAVSSHVLVLRESECPTPASASTLPTIVRCTLLNQTSLGFSSLLVHSTHRKWSTRKPEYNAIRDTEDVGFQCSICLAREREREILLYNARTWD